MSLAMVKWGQKSMSLQGSVRYVSPQLEVYMCMCIVAYALIKKKNGSFPFIDQEAAFRGNMGLALIIFC